MISQIVFKKIAQKHKDENLVVGVRAVTNAIKKLVVSSYDITLKTIQMEVSKPSILPFRSQSSKPQIAQETMLVHKGPTALPLVDKLAEQMIAVSYPDEREGSTNLAKANQTVNLRTQGLIEEVISIELAAKKSEAILLLAAKTGLRGLWRTPFKRFDESGSMFYRSTGDMNNVKYYMLSAKQSGADYYKGNRCEVVRIPLGKCDNFTVLLVRPVNIVDDWMGMFDLISTDGVLNIDEFINCLNKVPNQSCPDIICPMFGFEREFNISKAITTTVNDVESKPEIELKNLFQRDASFVFFNEGIAMNSSSIDVMSTSSVEFTPTGIQTKSSTPMRLNDTPETRNRKYSPIMFNVPFIFIVLDNRYIINNEKIVDIGFVFDPIKKHTDAECVKDLMRKLQSSSLNAK